MSTTHTLWSADSGPALRACSAVAVWGAALAAGGSADDALDAWSAAGVPTRIRAATAGVAAATGLPGPGEASATSAELVAFARTAGPATLLTPVAGDVRGLPTDPDVTAIALRVGAAVHFAGRSVALLPVDGLWRLYPAGLVYPAMSARDARLVVDTALREATAAVHRLEVARSAPRARERIAAAMIEHEVPLPGAVESSARSLLSQSIALQSVLEVAGGHQTNAATARDIHAVDSALRPLAAAVRESRRAALWMMVSQLHPPTVDLVGGARSGVRSTDFLGREA